MIKCVRIRDVWTDNVNGTKKEYYDYDYKNIQNLLLRNDVLNSNPSLGNVFRSTQRTDGFIISLLNRIHCMIMGILGLRTLLILTGVS